MASFVASLYKVLYSKAPGPSRRPAFQCKVKWNTLFMVEVHFPALVSYCNILKISPRAYIFHWPFLRGLFLEGLIYGGKFVLIHGGAYFRNFTVTCTTLT